MTGARESLLALLRERLSKKRYCHSLAVEKRAAFLAEIYGENRKKAALAGLLHDICHRPPYEEQLKIITVHGILLDDFTLHQPQLWHAVAGSLYIQDALGITDADVISAVRWHTTGRAGMTRLEQIVYLADLTSEDRTFEDIEKVRALSEQSLAAGMRYSLSFILGKLLREGRPIVKDAWEAYNYFGDKPL